MSEKKRDAGYRAALTGAKGKEPLRLLIYVCVILVIPFWRRKTSYQFGHDVFAEPVASEERKEVTGHAGAVPAWRQRTR